MRAFFMTPLVIFMLVIIVMLAKLMDSDTQENIALIGKSLPGFTLPAALEGTPGINSTEIKGKYILLNIFGSWCITCKIEHPFLMKLKRDKSISIYGINWRDSPENMGKFLKEKGNPYDAIGKDFEGKAIVDLGVTGAPESLLISPEGIVVFRYAGPLSEDIWNSKILPFLGEKK